MGVVAAELSGPPRVVAALVVVIAVAQVAGRAGEVVGQPRVLGEILGGIALGPSLLGAVAPAVSDWLFPPEVISGLRVIAQLGLVLFMFFVGGELELTELGSRRRQVLSISAAGMVVPFLGGVALAPWLHDRFDVRVGRTGFALFVGAAMAITAFPVLARIVADRGLRGTTTGTVSLAAAAVDDVSAWCLLAVVVAIVSAGGAADVVVTVAGAAAVVLVVALVVRPLLRRTGVNVAGAVVLAILIATATELAGVHSVFGAFIAGLALPRDAELFEHLRDRIEPVAKTALLPAFFVGVGLSTDIGSLETGWMWAATGLVIAVATVGKFAGATGSARWSGLGWHEAWSIGVLMNTRGLTEIVILVVGLELGVIDQRLFTAFVLMALVTTAMAGPALGVVNRWAPGRGAYSAASSDTG